MLLLIVNDFHIKLCVKTNRNEYFHDFISHNIVTTSFCFTLMMVKTVIL